MPRVSVCCAVKNQSEWLKEMIGSVHLQTYNDWELIIVDDGSTEDIRAVIEQFKDGRIRYIRFDENRGIPFGINRAMEEARGEFINPLAADELLVATKLAEQVEYMDSHISVDAIWGLPQNGAIGLRPTSEQFALRAQNRSREQWLRTLLTLDHIPIGGASMLCRKTVFDAIGYFDPQLAMFSDHEWFVRFFEANRKGVILPYRWATCRTANPDSSPQNEKNFSREMAYIRQKHSVPLPSLERTVTFGIAIYNMAHWLPECLNSLLAQTVQPHEIIILDDCSTDNLQEVLSQYNDPRIKFLRFDENRGNMAAQNHMVGIATGNFFCPIAADDVLAPDYLTKVLAEFEANPWSELVSCHTDFMDDKGEKITDLRRSEKPFYDGAMSIAKPMNQPRERLLAQLYYGNLYFGAGTYRTSALREVGGWNKELGVLSDYEMYLRLLQRENIRIVQEELMHTRLHDKNISNLAVNKPHQGLTLSQLYKKAKEPYFQPRMKVIIATPFYEMRGFSPYISSLATTIKTLTMLGIEHEFWELAGDSYVARARNTICTKFLEDSEATDLFFIDSDMSWNADAFVRMLMLPEEIIGASYPAKNMWEVWTSHPKLTEDAGHLRPMGRPLQDGSALLVAETVATGFMKIKRAALERFAEHYPQLRYQEPGADQSKPDRMYIEFFATERGKDGLWYGEDRMFCKRLKEMGTEMYIYPNVNMGHFGVKGWSGNYDQYLRKGGDGNRTGASSPGV